MANNVIRDGFTRSGYIATDPGIYQAMKFRYRPMLSEQSEVFISEDFRRRPPKQKVQMAAAAIVGQLVEWDETDENGPLPITVENVRRLPHLLFQAVLNVVAGFRASDPLPGASPAEQGEEDEYTRHLLASAASGETPGQAAERAERKN